MTPCRPMGGAAVALAAFVMAAVSLAHCSAACTPRPLSCDEYRARLTACVDDAGSRDESRACRERVMTEAGHVCEAPPSP